LPCKVPLPPPPSKKKSPGGRDRKKEGGSRADACIGISRDASSFGKKKGKALWAKTYRGGRGGDPGREDDLEGCTHYLRQTHIWENEGKDVLLVDGEKLRSHSRREKKLPGGKRGK